MRTKVVLVLLLGMMLTLGVLVAVRTREPHRRPAPPAAATASAFASAAPSIAASAIAAAPVDAGPARLMERPLRVMGLGWDTIVAGVLANRGVEPNANSDFTKAGVEVGLAASDKMSAVEAALARGGADKDGADVAIVPLPAFVASYERLRALSPEVFFVVGWSRGREALLATKGDVLSAMPAGEVKLAGAPGEAATFVGLFALDLAGAPADKVKLGAKPAEATLEAIDRGTTETEGGKKVLLTTADASRLVPYVAVSQRGMLDKHAPALTAWARAWLEAQKQLDGDPPAAARQASSAPGAPDPLTLLKRLGEVSPAPLGDVARVSGLSGRGAVTLEALFNHSWRLWRATGLLATPPPEAAPVNTAIVAALVRSDPSLAQPPAPNGKPKPATDKGRLLLVARVGDAKLDEPALLATIGMLAGVFERAVLRVSVRSASGGGVDAARTKKVIESAQGQFDLAPGRLLPGTKPVDKATAVVEVVEAS
jgi:hypothetical protein